MTRLLEPLIGLSLLSPAFLKIGRFLVGAAGVSERASALAGADGDLRLGLIGGLIN